MAGWSGCLLPIGRGRKPAVARIGELFVKAEDVLCAVVIRDDHDDAVGQADGLGLVFELLQRRFDVRGCLNEDELALPVVPVKLVEIAGGREAATAQAALGGSWGVSLAGAGMRISAMASTPM